MNSLVINSEQLYSFFDGLQGDSRCFYIDTFASLCFLHQTGKAVAAKKLMQDLFRRLPAEDENRLMLNNLLETLSGNEKNYALAVPLRAEFRALFTG